MQSFVQGKVDVSAAYVFDHPYQARKAGADIEIIDPADFGVNFYSDCLFARNDFIDSNSQVVEKFVHATLRGWDYALTNKEEAVTITLKHTEGLDRESQSFMLKEAEPLIRHENASRIGLVSADSLSKMVKILEDQEQLKGDVSVQKAFTNRFVESYYQKKGP